jgi:uncharacterized membrane protein YedE/YeeE
MTRQRLIVSFGTGLVFGLGLAISQMINPNKVLAFLDFFGDWDPSLAFVMIAAIGVNAFLFRVILRRPRPTFDVQFHMPSSSVVDWKLVVGSALFGLGWGLSGYCPGAAVAAVPAGSSSVLLFLGSMGLGMLGYHAWERATSQPLEPAAAE